MAAGLLLYAGVGPHGDIWLLELSFVLAGAGLALNTGPAVGLAMSAVPLRRAGLASGVVNLARLVGITVGVAVLGSAMAAVGAPGGACVIGGASSCSVPWWRCDGREQTARVDEKEVCHA